MEIPRITSAQNALIKTFSNFNRRKTPDQIRLDGPHLNLEYYQSSNRKPAQTLVSEKFIDDPEFKKFADWPDLVQIPDSLMTKLSPSQSPSGILSIAQKPNLKSQPATDLTIILEHIQDPGNLGTMLRTANAMGPATVLLLGNCVDIWNDKCLRAGMGAQFYIACEKITDLTHWKKQFNGQLLSTQLDGASLWKNPLPKPVALVFGNEGQGVTPSTQALCDNAIKIPMNDKAESLNVAASMAILTYEFRRQQVN